LRYFRNCSHLAHASAERPCSLPDNRDTSRLMLPDLPQAPSDAGAPSNLLRLPLRPRTHPSAVRAMADPFSAALIAQLPGLRRYATALAGNASTADDLVQDSIERALRRAGSLQNLDRMASWLRAILHNIFIDDLRRTPGRVARVDISDMENHTELSVTPDKDALHLDIVRAVNRLTYEHRQILLLAGLEGLSYAEIAGELDLPIGTVMSRLARAREKLRNLLEHGESSQFSASPEGGRNE
jgi:RNA polymerase sigma-70 factor, ECF subfamily